VGCELDGYGEIRERVWGSEVLGSFMGMVRDGICVVGLVRLGWVVVEVILLDVCFR